MITLDNDTQHNDTQHNDTKNNDTQHNKTQNNDTNLRDITEQYLSKKYIMEQHIALYTLYKSTGTQTKIFYRLLWSEPMLLPGVKSLTPCVTMGANGIKRQEHLKSKLSPDGRTLES